MESHQAWAEYCKSIAPAIVEACAAIPIASGNSGLLKTLHEHLPEWGFRQAYVRGGWYRLGGVLDEQGNKLSDNLEKWVEEHLESYEGDLAAFIDDYAGRELHATRFTGETHYLIAKAGEGTDDFLQLEIEALQEMRAHRLFANDPAGIEEIVDPRHPQTDTQALSAPRYRFARLQHIGAFLARMLEQKPEPSPIHRMLADWSRSSAGHTSTFYNHWVVASSEHLDRYHQPIFRAKPIATLDGPPPEFPASNGTSGLALQTALSRFDREAGYPMAWYFHLLSSKKIPHWVAQTAVEDALAGFAYLPQKDLQVVRDWLHQPYTV